MVLYLVVSFGNDNLLLQLAKSKNQDGILVSLSLFTIVEYSIFSFFLYRIIKRRRFKLIIITGFFIFLCVALISFVLNKEQGFDSLSTTTESIFIITFCIFFLFEELNDTTTTFIYQNAYFWFVFGMLVYLAGSFFLFLQASSLSKELRDGFWSIALFTNIFKNILFAIAFYLPKEKSNDSLWNTNEDTFQTTTYLEP